MKVVIVLGVFLLSIPFFHHHKSRVALQDYVSQASTIVLSYDDGSVNAALEQPEIVQIEKDLFKLSKMYDDDPASDALENQIDGEIKTLYHRDQLLSESAFI